MSFNHLHSSSFASSAGYSPLRSAQPSGSMGGKDPYLVCYQVFLWFHFFISAPHVPSWNHLPLLGVSWTPHSAKAGRDFSQSSVGISLLRQLEGCLSWFFHLLSRGIFPLSGSRWRGHSLLNQSWRTAHNGMQSQPQVTNCVAINEGFGARQNVRHSKFSALLPQKGNLWLLGPP